jgi:tRNA-specific 2-thiouridylase
VSNTVQIHPALQARLGGGIPPRLDEHGRPVRALLMYSGGLDSTLAGVLLRLQGIEVVALNMFTGLCLTDHKRKRGDRRKDGSRYRNEAIVGAAGLRIPVEVVDVREGYLKVLTEPRHGWGSAVNPCIDCRIHMLGHARRLLDEYDAHFIATGEVVGQRPMTQKRRQQLLIEKEADVEGLVLRPLSAHLMPHTTPERKGWVDRDQLLALYGRGRKPQIALAEQLGILDYPQPAGGCCFLTDGNYGHRLTEILDHKEAGDVTFEDVLLLKAGRHFRLPHGAKLVVGRNEGDNELLRSFWAMGPLLEVAGHKGPRALFLGPREDLPLGLRILARYSKAPADRPCDVDEFRRVDKVALHCEVTPMEPGAERAWLVQ